MHPLESSFRKLSRGNHHRNEANRLIQAFVKSEPYVLRVQDDPRSGERQWIMERVTRDPALGISIAVADCLYNLRSALDHLAWQLVLANGDQPTKRTAFPICDTSAQWKRSWKGKTMGMSRLAIALIKSFQPCFQNHPYRAKWASWLEAQTSTRHLRRKQWWDVFARCSLRFQMVHSRGSNKGRHSDGQH